MWGAKKKYVKKIEKLESYLSEGLPRYQDILEEKKYRNARSTRWN